MDPNGGTSGSGKPEDGHADDDGDDVKQAEPQELAVGGRSLSDFQQDEELRALEAAKSGKATPTDAERKSAARKSFRRFRDRERSRARSRECQTVYDLTGRRGGGRDGHSRPVGDAFPCDELELFGLIRPDNSRHPKRPKRTRPDSEFKVLLDLIIDNGLERKFLVAVVTHLQIVGTKDLDVVRLFVLITSDHGYDGQRALFAREDVDGDLRNGQNQHIAERLTAGGHPATANDVAKIARRLDRHLMTVARAVLRRAGVPTSSEPDPK